jgi:hypothetical protein
VRPRERERLALCLARVRAARRRFGGAMSSAVPLDLRAVAIAKPVLAELIRSLNSSEAVKPQGMVLGWRLLTEPGSPLYASPGGRPQDPDRLWYAVLSLLFTLRPLTSAARPTAEGCDGARYALASGGARHEQ